MTPRQKRDWREIKGPCPACGSTGWCSISSDGEAVICRRPNDGDGGYPVKQKDGSTARLFLVSTLSGGTSPSKPAKAKDASKKLTPVELAVTLKQHRTAINEWNLLKLAEDLAVSVESLKAYGVGWDAAHRAWSFPMYDGNNDAKGFRLCGIRLRPENGQRKSCVVGSSNGLFLPADFADRCRAIPPEISDSESPLLILLPEGPTDAAAARTLGFNAIGRPNNNGGREQIGRLLVQRPKQEVVIVADNDETHFVKAGPNKGMPYWPGIEGALTIARYIWPICNPLRFLMCPKGVKDLREWVKSGATAGDVMAAVMSAPVVNKEWLEAAGRRLVKKREQNWKRAEAA